MPPPRSRRPNRSVLARTCVMGGSKAARQSYTFGARQSLDRPSHTFGKPSHAWREGWLLVDGWPTQEGLADSAESHRGHHDVRHPAATLDGGEGGASCSRMGAAAARYPSWWPVVAEPTPAPTAPPPAPAAPPPSGWDVENLAVLNGALKISKVKERVDQTARAFKTPAPAPRAEAKPAAAPVPISWRFSDPEPATATATPPEAGVIAQQMQQMQQWMQMQQAMMQQMQQLQQMQMGAGMVGVGVPGTTGAGVTVGAMGPGGMPGAVGGTHSTQAIYTRGSQHGNKQAAPVKPKQKLTEAQKSRALSARGSHPCRAQAQAAAQAQAYAASQEAAAARARVQMQAQANLRSRYYSPHSQTMPCMRGGVKSVSSIDAIDQSYANPNSNPNPTTPSLTLTLTLTPSPTLTQVRAA
jgi:hypothetical protein